MVRNRSGPVRPLVRNPQLQRDRLPASRLLKRCPLVAVLGLVLSLWAQGQENAAFLPRIVAHPVGQIALEGDKVRLTVAARSDAIESTQFRWYKNRRRLGGNTDNSLVIESATADDAGLYEVVAWNSHGEVWSNPARLEIRCEHPSPGRLDPAFVVPTAVNDDREVRAVAVDGRGRVLVGGEFSRWGSSTARNLVRLKENGAVDTSFKIGSGTNGSVRAILVTGGDIWVGGSFTSFDGQDCHRMVRLSDDGRVASGFDLGVGPADGAVQAFLEDTSEPGEIFVGGTFRRLADVPIGYFAKFSRDGRPVLSFQPQFGSSVDGLARVDHETSRIIAVGGFDVGGYNKIARVFSDGRLDTGFFSGGRGGGASDQVDGVAVQADGKIIVCGRFDRIHGKLQRFLARLLPDGGLDPSFDVDPLSPVRTVAIDSEGGIVLGGEFRFVNAEPRSLVARLLENGTLDASFVPPGFSRRGTVHTVVPTEGRSVFAGGEFDLPRPTLAKLQGSAADSGEPVIRCDPVDWEVVRGEKAVLSVQATGETPLLYQWYRIKEIGDRLVRQTIDGAMDAIYRIDAVTPAEAGFYEVEVSNSHLAKRSGLAEIRVVDPHPGREKRHFYHSAPGRVAERQVVEDVIVVPDGFRIGDVDVTVNVTHPVTSLISATLHFQPVSGGSRSVQLIPDLGQSGANFIGTRLDDEARQVIKADNQFPPYAGTYRPVEPLSAFDGRSAAGEWTLRVLDAGEDLEFARLESWELAITEAAGDMTYDRWALNFFDQHDGGGVPPPDGDFDGDGLSNQVDFALVRAHPEGPRWFWVQRSPSGLTLKHHRWTSLDRSAYRYETSSDLETWVPARENVDFSFESIRVFPDGFEEVTLESLRANDDPGYWRVRLQP